MTQRHRNEKHIEEFAEHLKGIYAYDELKDQPLSELEKDEADLRIEDMKFRASFPGKESLVTGEVRMYANDDPVDDKMPLTPVQKQELDLLLKELLSNIRRARGHQIERRREWYTEMAREVRTIVVSVWGIVRSIRGKED